MLWRDVNPVLLRYLRVTAPAAAEDIAGETWVQVVRGLPGFRGDEQAWRAWLFTTARRRAADEVRRRSRHPVVPLAEAAGALEPHTEDAAGLAMENLATAAAIAAVSALPPLQAEVILLRVLAGLDTGAVARIVDRNPGAVRVRCPPRPAAAGSDAGEARCNAMTGGGVSDNDMPIFPWSSRGDVPPVGDPAFDALLAGNLRPEDTADGLGPVAEAIAALNAAPVTSELAAEASARAMFSAAGRSGAPVRSRRRRRPLVTALLSARLAVAAGAAATVGGAAAAAYAGALPAAAQRHRARRHRRTGAPRRAPSPAVGPRGAGPRRVRADPVCARRPAPGRPIPGLPRPPRPVRRPPTAPARRPPIRRASHTAIPQARRPATRPASRPAIRRASRAAIPAGRVASPTAGRAATALTSRSLIRRPGRPAIPPASHPATPPASHRPTRAARRPPLPTPDSPSR